MQAVIYVVDSSDVDRLGTSREEFHAILDEEELKNALILVYANKQDISGALTEAQVAEGLGLHDIKNRDWAIFKASAIKGTGLFEGLEWLSNMLKNRR
jgi:ADP-ribosylation factor-like protein 1